MPPTWLRPRIPAPLLRIPAPLLPLCIRAAYFAHRAAFHAYDALTTLHFDLTNIRDGVHPCTACGQPTMHEGPVCYGCAQQHGEAS